MKSSYLIASILTAPCAVAFVPSTTQSMRTMLQAENNDDSSRRQLLQNTLSSAAFLAVGLSPSLANAADIESFTLPSYDSSKGSTLMDINADLDKVNKQTLSQAKAKREYKDTSEEKLEADELRKAESEGASSLLDSLVGQSNSDKQARIEAEKAESKANRWKTF